jgi:hypothetical protein
MAHVMIASNASGPSQETKSTVEADNLTHEVCLYKRTVVPRQSMNNEQCMGELRIIMDSGFTSHMTPNIFLLSNYQPRTGSVALGSKVLSGLKITGIGDNWVLKNILHVPDLRLMLISESKLDKEGFTIVKENGLCSVLLLEDLIFTAHITPDNLYELDDDYKRILCYNTCYACEEILTHTTEQSTTHMYDSANSSNESTNSQTSKSVQFRKPISEIIPDNPKQNTNDGERRKRKQYFNPETSDSDSIYESKGRHQENLIGNADPMILLVLHRRFGHCSGKRINMMKSKIYPYHFVLTVHKER